MSTSDNVLPQYLRKGNPALKDYYPTWLDDLAGNVSLEGTLLDGVVVGAAAVRSVLSAVRSLYDRQELIFAGPCGELGFLEDYVAEVRGKPLGCVVVVTSNAAGQTQHIVAGYRPRSSVLHFASLLAEKFVGTPIAEHLPNSNSPTAGIP